MKRLAFFVFIYIILFLTALPSLSVSYGDTLTDMYEVIPDDAIRLRILANSDDPEDQAIKYLVRDEVSEQISSWVEHIDDIDEARALISNRVPEIKETIANVLKDENSKVAYDVIYDDAVTFPVKIYDTYIYPAGEYEAILITIGEGEGANWWCVLFPPLCFLDFGTGAHVAEAEEVNFDALAEVEEPEPVKIKFFLFEWFGWS